MKEPKKIYADLKRCDITFIPFESSQQEYISVNQLKEWINIQARGRQNDLGTNVTLSQLEKFINEP